MQPGANPTRCVTGSTAASGRPCVEERGRRGVPGRGPPLGTTVVPCEKRRLRL